MGVRSGKNCLSHVDLHPLSFHDPAEEIACDLIYRVVACKRGGKPLLSRYAAHRPPAFPWVLGSSPNRGRTQRKRPASRGIRARRNRRRVGEQRVIQKSERRATQLSPSRGTCEWPVHRQRHISTRAHVVKNEPINRIVSPERERGRSASPIGRIPQEAPITLLRRPIPNNRPSRGHIWQRGEDAGS